MGRKKFLFVMVATLTIYTYGNIFKNDEYK